jgi:hypothetical protein
LQGFEEKYYPKGEIFSVQQPSVSKALANSGPKGSLANPETKG